MRIVFMGTPDFAVPALLALADAGHEIAGVFCQPDRPVGRRQTLTPCPIKRAAQDRGIAVFQFEKIRRQEGLDALRALKPDLCVTAAFGQILSPKNLQVPTLGTVNIHASLLPQYRGASPIQQAILDGQTVTGVTTMYTDVGVDSGDIILQRQTPIGETETAGQLFERLATMGAQMIVQTVALIARGEAPRRPQDEQQATYCRMIEKQDGLLDFDREPFLVCAQVRGMNPWPVAYALLDGTPLKVYEARPCEGNGAPGEILCADPRGGLVAACRGGAVELTQIQAPGGKVLAAREYLRGHHIANTHLGGRNG